MFSFALISLFLFALYGVLIDYYRRAWKAIPSSSAPGAIGSPVPGTPGSPPAPGASSSIRKAPAPPQTRISVLVPARNEENNIRTCLESLSRQSYPKDLFEVIVIDDHSTDRTAGIINEFATGAAALITEFPALQTAGIQTGPSMATQAGPAIGTQRSPGGTQTGPGTSISCLRLAEISPARNDNKQAPPIKAYKKFAIETGIRAATGELIITTDADCWFHPDWLRTIAGFYEETGAKFIAAPVRIGEASGEAAGSHRTGNSFLSIFQTLDFITLQGITGAAVYRRFHSMCNGANLAYEKKVFVEVDGFKDIDDIPSGDDMLLMHKIYKKYPGQVFFLKNRRAIVSTRPETSWKGFVNQRVRWASKADKYDDKRIFWVLLLVYLLNLFLIVLLLASWWNSWYLWLLLILLTVKTAVEFPFVRSVAAFFGQRRLMLYFPALQPFHIIYTVVIGWLGKFGSYRWKERKITK